VLNIPDPETMLELYANNKVHPHAIDVMATNRRHFLMNISMGVTSRTMKHVDTVGKRVLGSAIYYLHAFWEILKGTRISFSMTIDGKKIHKQGVELFINNFGIEKRFPISSTATPDNGVWECYIIEKYATIDKVVPLRINKHIAIKVTSNMPIQADGDAFHAPFLEVTLKRKALQVMVPDKHL
jgi:diacylglycerol kinase family enzyme